MKHILLSKSGGDRATAYTMSNKIVSLPAGCLCTWIDSQRQNRWALLERERGRILRSGALGTPCIDNHCGAALVLTQEAVHAITGGHHSPFQHYRMDLHTADTWQHVTTIDVQGTYPSVISDSSGRLHLAYRSPGDQWTLDYCRFEKGHWTPAQSLITAEKTGYIYWTNGIAVGADDAIHLVFGNTRVLADSALCYSASHIFSRDSGKSWCNSSGSTLSLPTPVSSVPLMTGDITTERIQSVEKQREYDLPGPKNVNYQQILLSNPVIDESGAVHAVLHNGLTGSAELMTFIHGKWSSKPLTTVAASGDGNGDAAKRVHVQSSLSIGPAGRLHVALMIEDTGECVWGPPGTYIVLVEVTSDGHMSARYVTTPDAACAQWLPAFEHVSETSPNHAPPLLYTKGINGGGFGNNKNRVETEVYLCLQ